MSKPSVENAAIGSAMMTMDREQREWNQIRAEYPDIQPPLFPLALRILGIGNDTKLTEALVTAASRKRAKALKDVIQSGVLSRRDVQAVHRFRETLQEAWNTVIDSMEVETVIAQIRHENAVAAAHFTPDVSVAMMHDAMRILRLRPETMRSVDAIRQALHTQNNVLYEFLESGWLLQAEEHAARQYLVTLANAAEAARIAFLRRSLTLGSPTALRPNDAGSAADGTVGRSVEPSRRRRVTRRPRASRALLL